MKTRVAIALLSLLLFAGPVVAVVDYIWHDFNVRPFAKSRPEAMAGRERVFRAMGLSQNCVQAAIAATNGPPIRQMIIKNGDRFDRMAEKDFVVQQNVLVAFKATQRGIYPSASTEVWRFDCDGETREVGLPEICFNWLLFPKGTPPPAPVAAAPTPPPATMTPLPPPSALLTCPDVYFLKINVWDPEALKLPGVEATHAKEELGQGNFSLIPHVSKTHGKQFRVAYAGSHITRTAVPVTLRLSFIMTPEAQGGSQKITSEQPVGDVLVTGLRELRFPRQLLEAWDAIRLVLLQGELRSPPRFNGSGVQELRFFNRLPGKVLGEWSNNPDPDCIMNAHFIR